MKRPSALLRHDPGTEQTASELTERATVPVLEERAQVDKRVVETARVRIRKRVEARDEPLEITAWRDEVHIERVPVGRVVDTIPPVRHESGVTIVPVVEEVVVTVRQLVLKEELRISTRRELQHDRRTVRLRRERIEVDRVAVGSDSDPGTSRGPITQAAHRGISHTGVDDE